MLLERTEQLSLEAGLYLPLADPNRLFAKGLQNLLSGDGLSLNPVT